LISTKKSNENNQYIHVALRLLLYVGSNVENFLFNNNNNNNKADFYSAVDTQALNNNNKIIKINKNKT